MRTKAWLMILLAVAACGSKKDKDAPAATAPATAPAAASSKAATFWAWFSDHAAALRADKDLRATMESIGAEMEKAYPGVFAEIGADGDNRMLVISADGNKDLFPAVKELYAARPTVKGWTVVAFRPRAKPGDPAMNIELGGKKVDPTQVKVVATPAGPKLDIQVFIPGYTTNEEMGNLAFVLLDHVLGEYDVEMKIGVVDFAPVTKAPAAAKPITDLPAMVDALK